MDGWIDDSISHGRTDGWVDGSVGKMNGRASGSADGRVLFIFRANETDRQIESNRRDTFHSIPSTSDLPLKSK